jgi:predicted AlkP superfamily phosphohydrolase/phosphomutase
MKVLVIGLDGASWNLLKPWIDEGKLPTLKKLIEEGVSGNLESSIPPVTFPAWKCYSTGKNPGKLGTYHWMYIDFDKQKIGINDSLSFKSKEIWDYIGCKLRVGIIDLPTTFPPKKVNGFMISGGIYSSKGFTYPRELEQKLREKYNYEPFIETLIFDTKIEEAVEKVRAAIKSRFEVAKDALRYDKIDFLNLCIFYIDTLQHYLWDSKEVEDVWKYIDDEIGKILDLLKDDWIVIIMSDHGFTSIKATFNVNVWLQQNGFLSTRVFGFGKFFFVTNLNRQKLYSFIKKIKLIPLLKKLPRPIMLRLAKEVPDENIGMRVEGMEKYIDWKNTKAIAIGDLIYINRKSILDYEKIRDKLITELESIEDPRSGEKIVKRVYRREEVYWGAFTNRAPDLVILPNTGYRMNHGFGPREVFEFKRKGWIATHKPEGILIVYGPGIKKGEIIEKAKIIDVAPTILHILGIPIPSDMDGRVLKEIFREDSEFARRELVYQVVEEDKTLTEKERVRKRISEIKRRI